jgi:hypothetical protein
MKNRELIRESMSENSMVARLPNSLTTDGSRGTSTRSGCRLRFPTDGDKIFEAT